MYICLNEKNYLIPNSVVDRYRESLFKDFNNDNYLDIDKIKDNYSEDFLISFYHDCVNAVGVYAFNLDDIYLEGYNSLKNELKELDEKLKERDNKQLFCDKLFTGLEVILDFYMKILEEEKIEIKGR